MHGLFERTKLSLKQPICAFLFGITSWLMSSESVDAALILSLSSDAPDPTHLHVGDTVHVQVTLAGLSVGDELISLSARSTFDAGLLGTPSISAGSIVPNPLNDPLDLTNIAEPGAADVTFFTLGAASGDHITSNGVFYEFDVTAQALGSTTIQFAFADAQQIDSNDSGNLLSPTIDLGSPLQLAVVPEPTTAVLAFAGFATWMATCRRGFRVREARHASEHKSA